MSGQSSYRPQSRFMNWFEARLPVASLLYGQFVSFPTPRNLNGWWTFGAILTLMLAVQIVTGVVLVMHYAPNVDLAFDSVELLMRDVNYGWLLRYLHSNGSSLFFFAAYVHMFRGMYYGSYKAPREVLWIIGVIILLLMVATGFLGYVLPWGQMSYWAATVITNLFSAFPAVGDPMVAWLWGGYAVGNPTLTRFFSLHYLLPFVIVGFVILHIWALHVVGQNNPTGVEARSPRDTVPFTPYATVKDLFYFAVFLVVYAWFVFYTPNYLGHPDNYIPANPSVTPTHIVPEWYYLPLYAILRAIPDKLLGVVAMFGAVLVFAFLPWLDWSKTRSGRYRPYFRWFFWLFVAVCIGLGWLGSQPPEGVYVVAARVLTAWYFLHFFAVLPILSSIEKAEREPGSIADDLLTRRKAGATAVMGLLVVGLAATAGPARADGDAATPPRQDWSFAGPLGGFDRAQLQRGFQVYREVCQGCHGLRLLSFRNLGEPGGPEFSPAQVVEIAAAATVKDGPNDKGETFERPGRPADRFPPPFANDQAASAAFGGFSVPDLSVIAKARGYQRGFPWFLFDVVTLYQELGIDYLYALLTGYEEAPADAAPPPGTYYNKYFPGNAFGMPNVLSDDQVKYADGAPQTPAQYAKDVSAFLMWAAEPHLEARKRLGLPVMAFLIVFATLLYFSNKKVWRSVDAMRDRPDRADGGERRATNL